MPLLQAVSIFQRYVLQSIVITRIYNDAVQIVDHNDQFDGAWATRVRELAEEKYDRTLQHKVGELTNYYSSSGWERDQHDLVQWVVEDKLNPGYQPLHSHDSINLLCRILGVRCSIEASN